MLPASMMPAMDVLNKLVNTVSSTVSTIQYALPGNAVSKDYNIYGQIASAGPGLLWKVYSGSKKTTKQPVSVFVMEKKTLDRYTRRERDDILETLKDGVVQLTKIRHPRILTVQHPLEESRDSIAFATEPIFASLSNVLGNQNNMPANAVTHMKDFALHEVEIKTGLLQLAEALAFLHNDARILHRNICPSSVVINKEGGWKLFGFDYAVHATSTVGLSGDRSWSIRHYQGSANVLLNPDLDYLAPEHICAESNEPASDLYSLALLIYSLYSAEHCPPMRFQENTDQFRRFAADLEHGCYPNLGCLPAQLADHVRASMNARPALRPLVHDLARVPFFEDERVKMLNYLDTAFQWTNLQKSQFYKGLPAILGEMPTRINNQHVLPALVREFANPAMIPFVLPAYFLIAGKCSRAEYAQLFHAPLKPVLQMQEPIQILLILVQHIELMLRQTPATELQTDVLPMLYRALETDQPQMQQMCLSILPAFARTVDQNTVKNGILPRLRKLCTAPNSATALVVNGLVCVGHLLDYMDKWLVLDEVIPMLMNIKTRDANVIMAIVSILRSILDSSRLGITKDVMAGRLIPFLMPLAVENNLALDQFETVISMVKKLVDNVEREQRSKIVQLQAMQASHSLVAETKPITNIVPALQTNAILSPKAADKLTKLSPIQSFNSNPLTTQSLRTEFNPSPNYTLNANHSTTSRQSNLQLSNINQMAIQQLPATRVQGSSPMNANPIVFNKSRSSEANSSSRPLIGTQTTLNLTGMSATSPMLMQPTNVATRSQTNNNSNSNVGTLSNQDILDFLN